MQKFRWRIAQFFERNWWKNYLKGKSPEKYLEWKRHYWIGFLDKLDLTIPTMPEPIIDIGCGPAGMFLVLEEKRTTALDPLIASYEDLDIFAIKKYPKVKFVSETFEEYKTEVTFKTVFCLNAINHFVDLDLSFKKLADVCQEGGKVILSVDAHNHSLFRRFFAFLPLDILHPHQYYLEEYEGFLKNAGFKIESKVLIKKAFFFDYWVLVGRKV